MVQPPVQSRSNRAGCQDLIQSCFEHHCGQRFHHFRCSSPQPPCGSALDSVLYLHVFLYTREPKIWHSMPDMPSQMLNQCEASPSWICYLNSYQELCSLSLPTHAQLTVHLDLSCKAFSYSVSARFCTAAWGYSTPRARCFISLCWTPWLSPICQGLPKQQTCSLLCQPFLPFCWESTLSHHPGAHKNSNQH